MKVLHRYTGEVLLEIDTMVGADLENVYLEEANLKNVNLINARLSGARLSGADLSGADLSGADLSDADLSDVGLWGTVGNREEIVTLQTPECIVNMTKDIIQIGCENHTHRAWHEFNDEDIRELGGAQALSFWKEYKTIIFKLVRINFGRF